MCTAPLPLGVNPIAVNKYIISFRDTTTGENHASLTTFAEVIHQHIPIKNVLKH